MKAEKALEQIKKNNYDNDFIEDGYEEIMHVGIAFFKKRCVVKCKIVKVIYGVKKRKVKVALN